ETRVLLGHYGVDLWERHEVSTLEQAVSAGEMLGWDVVLKATAERLRQHPGLPHVWRNISDATDMQHAWESLSSHVVHDDEAAFAVQRTAGPGVPVAVGGLEDPLFGPAVWFSVAGSLTDLVGDKAFRIP